MGNDPLAVVDRLLDVFSSKGKSIAVDYNDCLFFEPINWLYPVRQPDGAWREETWALELFFKGYEERAGSLFHAIETDFSRRRKEKVQRIKHLDQIALLSLRRAVLQRLLDEYPGLVFSINVTAVTLADASWFQGYIDGFIQELRKHSAQDRVVLEIQEHPPKLLKDMKLDGNALSRRLEILRHSPITFAIDDAYSPNYVFPMTKDSLDGRIVWQKMDWQYFQEKANDACGTLRSGIRGALVKSDVQLIIEGVESETLKGFLCNDILKGDNLPDPRRVAIQSRNTQIILSKNRALEAPLSGIAQIAPQAEIGQQKATVLDSMTSKQTGLNSGTALELQEVSFLNIVPRIFSPAHSIDPFDQALVDILSSLSGIWLAIDYDAISKAQGAALQNLIIAGLVEERLLIKSEMEEFGEKISLRCRVCGTYENLLIEKIFTFMPHWRNDQNKTVGHWTREIDAIVHARLTIEGERAKQDLMKNYLNLSILSPIAIISMIKLLSIPGSVGIEAKQTTRQTSYIDKPQEEGIEKMDSGNAIAVWRERKDFLETELAKTSDASKRFSIKKEMEECDQSIKRLGHP